MTKKDRTRLSAVMMSSTRPSAKYSCSGSPLMLVNGRTAIDGLSGGGNGPGRPGSASPAAVGGAAAGRQRVGPHRLVDVLDALGPEIGEAERRQQLADMLVGRRPRRRHRPARRGPGGARRCSRRRRAGRRPGPPRRRHARRRGTRAAGRRAGPGWPRRAAPAPRRRIGRRPRRWGTRPGCCRRRCWRSDRHARRSDRSMISRRAARQVQGPDLVRAHRAAHSRPRPPRRWQRACARLARPARS